jgi:glycosyltransferase involved in cell wall biosynthesis
MIYIISPFESKIEARGTRNIELSNLLISNKYDVTFITSDFSHQFKKNYLIQDMKEKLDTEIYKTVIFAVAPYFTNLSIKRMKTHISFAYQLYNFLDVNIKDGDTVITSSIPPELTLAVYLLKRRRNITTILDVRDIWPDAFPLKNNFAGILFSFYCNTIYKLTLRSFDKISYVANSFNDWISKYTSNNIKVFIPLGYDADRWKNIEYKPVTNKIKLVYIGNISYQFDIRLIVDFVNKNEKYEFHIIGDGETLNELKDLSKTDRNIFYGRCAPEKVVELVKSKDIAILPISENSTAYMPNKLFDYLGAGIPILSLGENDSSIFVKENNIGWTCSFNLEDIKNTLYSISIEDMLQKHNNILKIRSQYSKEALYNKFLKILNTKEKN